MIRVRIVIIPILLSLTMVGAGRVSAQGGYDLFQQALVRERTEGKIAEAIGLYQRIVREFPSDRALVARSLLAIGQSYEKLGNVEATKTYDRLVREYVDQREQAAVARTRLAALDQRANGVTRSGMVARQVWDEATGRSAAISPDGRSLVFAGSSTGLFVRDLRTGTNRRLTMEPITSGPIVSPDGRLVAYGTRNAGGYELRLIGIDGSASRVIKHTDEWIDLGAPTDWSRDGRQLLAMARTRDAHRHIVLISLQTGAVQRLKALGRTLFPFKTSLSPDGRYVAYDFPSRTGSTERDVFILAVDGSHDVPLVRSATHDDGAIWAPDGSGVFFISRRAGNENAAATRSGWFARVSAGKPQGTSLLIRPDMGENAVPLGFTRSGTLFYSLGSEMNELYLAAVDPATGAVSGVSVAQTQRVVTGTASGGWSHGGQHIAYESMRPSARGEVGVIVIRNMATGEERELESELTGVRSWSPDDRYLLLDTFVPPRRWGLFRVDVSTGAADTIAWYPRVGNYEHPVWSPTGKAIVVMRNDSVGSRIVSRDIETKVETELYRLPAGLEFGSCLEASADGRHVAFYVEDETTQTMWVMVMSTTGENPRQIGTRVKYPEVIDDILTLTPDGQHVLYSTYSRAQEHPQHRYWRVDVNGGTPSEFQLFQDGYIGNLRIHPDGKRITFARASNRSAIWMMENFLPGLPPGSRP